MSRARIVLAGLLALLGACRGGPALAPGSGPAAPKRVLLLPLNVTLTLPAEVEEGADAVTSELRAYLEERGLEIETLELAVAREAWVDAAMTHKGEVGSQKLSFDGAAGTLARRLHETHRFDALLVPWIVLGEVRVKARTAEWDGVERKLEFVGPGVEKTRWLIPMVRLSVRAASLQVAAFSPDGAKLFQDAGGLDLVDRVELDLGPMKKVAWSVGPMPEVLQDRAHLREGIALALSPLVPPPREEAK